jgi:hypothetical protein
MWHRVGLRRLRTHSSPNPPLPRRADRSSRRSSSVDIDQYSTLLTTLSYAPILGRYDHPQPGRTIPLSAPPPCRGRPRSARRPHPRPCPPHRLRPSPTSPSWMVPHLACLTPRSTLRGTLARRTLRFSISYRGSSTSMLGPRTAWTDEASMASRAAFAPMDLTDLRSHFHRVEPPYKEGKPSTLQSKTLARRRTCQNLLHHPHTIPTSKP